MASKQAHHWAPTVTLALVLFAHVYAVWDWSTADIVFAAPAGLVVTAPVNVAAVQVFFACRTVLFVPSADGFKVSTRFGKTGLAAVHAVAVVTVTDGCCPDTMTAFVALAVATMAYAWVALKV